MGKSRQYRRDHPEVFHFKKRNRKKRKGAYGTNVHHLTNRCKGGKSDERNLLTIKVVRHRNLHALFGNMSWEEIGSTLKSIFGVSDPKKCIEVIDRISLLKGRTPSRSPDLPGEHRAA